MLEPRIAAAYDAWRAQPGLPEDLAAELASIQGDEEAITDRFYRELAFGTGGLRGVIGAGTNRMNVYNIRKATQGLADYLNASGLPKKAAIGYDSRIARGTMPARPVAVTTIVSTDMATPVAAKYGVDCGAPSPASNSSASRSACWKPPGRLTAISSALRRATATCPGPMCGTRTR